MKRTLLLLLIIFALVFPVMGQEEPIQADDDVDTTTVVIGAFITIGVAVLGVVFVSVQSGKSISEAARAGSESAVRGIISSEPIAAWGETGLSHIPEPVRKVILSVNDAFSPFTSRTTSDLDEKTQEWIRNLLDGDPSTGAVSLDKDNNPF